MGYKTLTLDPEYAYPKRHESYWSESYWSESSVSSVSQASLSSLSIISLSSGSNGNTIPSETFTTTFTSDGTTYTSTFTTATIVSAPTPQPTVTGTQSGPYTGGSSMSSIVLGSSSTLSPAPTPSNFLIGASDQAVCVGQGLDTQAIGVLTTLIWSAAVGFIIWAIFAFLRPRVRSLYAIREWFCSPGLRPPELSNGFFAFLHPPVPLVPSLPSTSDIDDAREARINPQPGQPNPDPAQLFASDEQLAQRTLWVVFLICLGLSFLALAVALPVYLVNTPCLPASDLQVEYGGRYGTLNDLSLMRLLRMMDDGSINTKSRSTLIFKGVWRRLVVNGKDLTDNAYARIIAICCIVIFLAILPILWKLWKEFTALAEYHKAWDEDRCESFEMGYLSCGTSDHILLGNRGGAWGWRGWGEGKVKAFFRKAGLGGGNLTTAGKNATTAATGGGEKSALLSTRETEGRRRHQPSPGSSEERADAEINVTSVFSVGDTTRLSELLDERDIILDNLEIAETRYIQSFQPITPTPSPSLRATLPLPAGDQPTEEQTSSDSHKGFLSTLTQRRPARPLSSHSGSSDPSRDLKAQISRPRPLKGSYSRSRKGYTPVVTGPTYPPNLSQTYVGPKSRVKPRKGSTAGSSVGHDTKTPTTYLAPSRYYKLNGVEGVSGGKIGSESEITGTARGADNQSPGLAHAIKGRLTGSRFLEVNRDSSMFGKLPLGSKMIVDEHGMLNPAEPIRGPNQEYADDEVLRPRQEPTSSTLDPSHSQQETDQTKYNPVEQTISEDHELVLVEDAADIPTDQYANPVRARPRPRKTDAAKHTSRETFPMRTAGKGAGSGGEEEPPHLRLQARQPFHRPITGLDHDALGAIYADIRHWRAALKAINRDIAEEQEKCFEDLAEGRNVKGWILVGKGLRFLPGIDLIEGRSKEDVRWDELQRGGGMWSDIAFWIAVAVIGMLLGVGLLAAAGLALVTQPDVVHYLPFLSPVVAHNNIQSGIATALAPAIAASLFVGLAMFGIHRAAGHSGAVSVTVVRIKAFKAVFWVIVIVAGMWIVAAGSLIFGAHALDRQEGQTQTVANGSVATAVFLLFIIINLAIIVPGLLLLQPVRLWHLYRAKKKAVTPRQEFRAMYPRVYNPVYAMGCCILGIVFVCAFAILFPLIAPAVLLLIFLTLIAHRFLIGYVYGRTDSGQTGGLLQLWIIRRFATLLALQPFLLGLIILSRRKWILGGIMVGIAVAIVILVEWYCHSKLKKPGVNSLSPVTRNAIETYVHSARPAGMLGSIGSNEKASAVESSTRQKGKDRKHQNGSISSVLDMMSITLAVMPGTRRNRPPVPLPTEHLDDLIATEKAARTHPDARPQLPPLDFVDHAEEMAGILYPPELTAPPPVIWLPNDSAGIARSEAFDLQHYHHLATVIDVRSKRDLPSPRHSAEDRRGATRVR